MNKNNKQFDLKEFATGNNVTVIELNGDDFLYIQIPKVETDSKNERNTRMFMAHRCFEHLLPKVKFLVDDTPLKFTIITKKEEFVARLNDDIVQL